MKTVTHKIATFAAFVLVVLISVQQIPSATAACPIDSSFTYTAIGNNTYNFTANQIQDTYTQYFWNFGDGNSSSSKQTTHTYQLPGVYEVYLFVNDSSAFNTQTCNSVAMQQIIILDTLPCIATTHYIDDTIYNNQSGTYSIYLQKQNCFFGFHQITNLILPTLGSLTYNFGFLNYNYLTNNGNDHFIVLACDTIQQVCDTFDIRVALLPLSQCNIMNEDTIYLAAQKSYYGQYNFSNVPFYDSINQTNNPFVLETWTSSNGTLSPNRLFNSFDSLYAYMDSVAGNNILQKGNRIIYSTDSSSIRYVTGSGISLFFPTEASSYTISFNFSTRSNASFCSDLLWSHQYTFTNTSPYVSIGSCFTNNNYNYQFYFSRRGTFNISILDSINNCIDTVVFIVGDSSSITICDTVTCVLPGDADHDLTVNNFDVLAVGLSYNRTGNNRTNATTQYYLQKATDWNTTHYYGYNDKFADCNGDGVINIADVNVIDQNYIALAQNIFNHRDLQNDSIPFVTLAFDSIPTFTNNNTCEVAQITADIIAGNATLPLENTYGIAFSINYPFENDSCFNINVELDSASWLQTNDSIIFFYKNVPAYQRVDVAIVRKDGMARSGIGSIGTVNIITEGAVFVNGRIAGDVNYTFSVTDVAAITNIGEKIDITGSTIDMGFIIASTQQHKIEGLNFYPNPLSNKLFIQAKEIIETIKISDLSGKLIHQLSLNKNAIEVDCSNLSKGMYIIEIKSNNGVSIEKIIKQ